MQGDLNPASFDAAYRAACDAGDDRAVREALRGLGGFQNFSAWLDWRQQAGCELPELVGQAVEQLIRAACAVHGAPEGVWNFVASEPIESFRGRTLLELAFDGRVDDAIRYMESISSGFSG